ncbi:MAG: hypothetical protein ACRDWE_09585, partial [Acidimicrobiales bacterium]
MDPLTAPAASFSAPRRTRDGAAAPGGLYDARFEHDACGMGMVADLSGRPSHDIVAKGLTVLERLAHRGASGAEVDTGDGSGILVQVPDDFLREQAIAHGVDLPPRGRYVIGCIFLPTDHDDAAKVRATFAAI